MAGTNRSFLSASQSVGGTKRFSLTGGVNHRESIDCDLVRLAWGSGTPNVTHCLRFL